MSKKITFSDFDKLNLKGFAENLFQIVEKGVISPIQDIGQQGGYTISLNAEFGNGKTTFLKMFEHFITTEKQNYDVLFINAWETDFQKEPVIAILLEFINYLELAKSQNQIQTKSVNNLITIITNTIGTLTNQFIKNKTGFDIQELKKHHKNNSNSINTDNAKQSQALIGNNILKEFKGRKTAIKNIKEVILEYTKKERKLLIIIDELDRARPDYAVHFLEDMKHFFDIKNVVFLVAVNKKQMEATVKCLYGQDLDFNGYYMKFFKQDINLPDPYKEAQKLVDSLIKQTKVQYLTQENCGPLIENKAGRNEQKQYFYLFCKMFNLTLREVETFIRIFNVILGRNNKASLYWAYHICYFFFICLFIKHKQCTQEVLSGKWTLDSFINFLDKIDINYKWNPRNKNANQEQFNNNFLLGVVSYTFIRFPFQTEVEEEDFENQVLKHFPAMKERHVAESLEGFYVHNSQLAVKMCETINQCKSSLSD